MYIWPWCPVRQSLVMAPIVQSTSRLPSPTSPDELPRVDHPPTPTYYLHLLNCRSKSGRAQRGAHGVQGCPMQKASGTGPALSIRPRMGAEKRTTFPSSVLRRCRGSHSRCFHAYVGHEWMDPTSAELRGPPEVRRPRLDGPCLGRAAAASKRASTRTALIQPRGGVEGASWRASTRSGLIRSRGSCGGWSERVGREWIDPATLELQQRICAEAWGDQHHRKPSVENSPFLCHRACQTIPSLQVNARR